MSAPRIVLGPQRPNPNLRAVLDALPGEGGVVLVSAGWRYDETDAYEVLRGWGLDVTLLPLYAWFDALIQDSPAVGVEYRTRQERIKELKTLYRLRLRHAIGAVAGMLPLEPNDPALVGPEIEAALADIRKLDSSFVSRTAQIHDAFPLVARPWEHTLARARHEACREALAGAKAVLIAGGNVGVLRNRLRFFGFEQLLTEANAAGTAIIAWSAGAMALSERVVLFYDDPPDGPAWPEVFDAGLGLLPGAVFLPHARRRLRLDDAARVRLMAARFGPGPCIGLELGAHVAQQGGQWRSYGERSSALLLGADGHTHPLEVADVPGA